MAGIYLHIPFCKSRCRYCDFYSTTALTKQQRYVDAVCREISLRKADFDRILAENASTLRTIYFGGGTPSTLCESDIVRLLTAIRTAFPHASWEEITLEANPGDLTLEKLEHLRRAGINRLSIGIQSFQDALLHTIGRRHTSEQAQEAVRTAQRAGFTNISIDLMYGLPGQTLQDWQRDIQTALSLGVQHISAYCLTYEEGTPLYAALQRGEVAELDDDLLNLMQDHLQAALEAQGLTRYEISNYALPACESKHNSSYWTGEPYLGLGAGAHSYDGAFLRQWNPDDIDAYLAALEGTHEAAPHPLDGTLEGSPLPLEGVHLPLEGETLTPTDRYNEAVMLGLRTRQGISLQSLSLADRNHLLLQASKYITQGWLAPQNASMQLSDPSIPPTAHLVATHAGTRMLNAIIEDLMQ